ncbi:MAG: hypothetical protein GY759_02400 [Chloroflexi bacterium]|nr:hypothetical protein [Chloroflexota bacterium]
MLDSTRSQHLSALQHFQYARWQANLEQILSRINGASPDLLSYEETRRLLRARNTKDRGLRDIPLDAIVGSVGRYTDFTRSFMPLRDSDRHRWASVEVGMTGPTGLPPIEVYQIGDVYFVRDGNHRVSVARQLEMKSIEAYVSEVQTKFPLTPDVKLDDLIMAAEYIEFLERTRLDELRPDADLRVTLPGRYQEILEHIDLHHYLLSDGEPERIHYEKAVLYWYDEIYTPIADRIERQGMLRDFPGRTPLDLYMC